MAQTLQINPTRMELLKQKQRLQAARRAYDLLEDKRDKLIQQFFPLIKEIHQLRRKVEADLTKIYLDFEGAKAINSEKEIEAALWWPEAEVSLKITNFTSLRTPQFKPSLKGDIFCYGFLGTNWRLDKGLRDFWRVFPRLLELAQKEDEVRRLAQDIERTRRRVNALEYILIPQIEQAVKHITMKLEERERAHIINLMKIKEMIEG